MKTKISALWPDDISDAIDLGIVAAVCLFNNPVGNVKKYVADECEIVLMNRIESYAADGLSRREISRLVAVGRAQFMETVRESYRDAAARLKKFPEPQSERRAILIYNEFLTPIWTISAKDFRKDSNNDAIRAQFLRQERFDAVK